MASKTYATTTVVGAQDRSANGAGAQSVTLGGSGSHKLDQRSGYVEGNSTGTVRDGSGNVILGTGSSYETTYVEQLSDDVVSRALDTVDSSLAGAFDFARSSGTRADNAVTSAVDLADTVARRSAEYADAARLTLENVADPAGKASRVTLYIVAGLAALGLFFFRPRKSKA